MSAGAGRPAFVATTGGHLVQLYHLSRVVEPDRHEDGVWVTHRTPQSESLLAGRRVHYVPFVHARRYDEVLRATPRVLALLRREGVDVAYSTGAAISLAALPLAPLVGARGVFIESLARADGPSASGRVHERLPWLERWTQYPQNAGPRWKHRFSVLDSFEARPAGELADPQRVLVTLGTARPWGFRRLVERLLQVLPPTAEVVWQTGATDVSGLGVQAVPMMSDADFRAEVERADVVVSHAGVGSFIRCLEVGKAPVLVPRRAARGEHLDDHQLQIAAVAQAKGLAVSREVDDLTWEDLRTAASLEVAWTAAPRG